MYLRYRRADYFNSTVLFAGCVRSQRHRMFVSIAFRLAFSSHSSHLSYAYTPKSNNYGTSAPVRTFSFGPSMIMYYAQALTSRSYQLIRQHGEHVTLFSVVSSPEDDSIFYELERMGSASRVEIVRYCQLRRQYRHLRPFSFSSALTTPSVLLHMVVPNWLVVLGCCWVCMSLWNGVTVNTVSLSRLPPESQLTLAQQRCRLIVHAAPASLRLAFG